MAVVMAKAKAKAATEGNVVITPMAKGEGCRVGGLLISGRVEPQFCVVIAGVEREMFGWWDSARR